MLELKSLLIDTLKEAYSTTKTLLKIMIPISIIVKILTEIGFVRIIGEQLSPVMNIVGMPGEFGLVWGTAMITNIYGGLIIFFNLAVLNSYSIAQVTVLSSMILIAHTLPIEISIARKAGVRPWFTFLLRIISAFTLGIILNIIFKFLNLYQNKALVIWNSGIINPSIYLWILNEIKNYIIIFLIIIFLILFMNILKKTGIISRLNNILKPALELIGMSKEAAPVTIIGMTLGLSYGGGLIINEAKSGILNKKDIFFSLSLMCLCHGLIEDTLLMLLMGAALIGILIGRLIFAIIAMIILINIISRISNKKFEKYFLK